MGTFKEQINREKVPEHIAVIMDGNGRWAKKKNRPRLFGHKKGADSVRRVVEASVEIGVKYLTLYTFSKENWKRSESEVNSLMSLLLNSLNSETKTLMQNNVRLLAIGDLDNLPKRVKAKLEEVMKETASNTGLELVLALSYGSRWEIIKAVKKIGQDIKDGKLNPEDITNDLFAASLETSNIPDPELLIRTSGESRISNFLLWQIAYSELYFTKKYWPEMEKEDFYEAIFEYQNRERRFGKTSEQLKFQTENVQK
jgi:undecaprenyl diphosphate synthase